MLASGKVGIILLIFLEPTLTLTNGNATWDNCVFFFASSFFLHFPLVTFVCKYIIYQTITCLRVNEVFVNKLFLEWLQHKKHIFNILIHYGQW